MATSTCRNPPATAGTGCGGLNVCSASGACVRCIADSGCGDGNDCTSDVCNTRTGACVNTVTVGAACGSAMGCNTNACNAQGQCVGTPSDAACADEFACTIDVCTMTGCVSTPDNTACGPSADSCSVPRCDVEQGCVLDRFDDGRACVDPLTGLDGGCTAGVCVPLVGILQ
jgi:hypothetical protein